MNMTYKISHKQVDEEAACEADGRRSSGGGEANATRARVCGGGGGGGGVAAIGWGERGAGACVHGVQFAGAGARGA